MPTSVVRLLEVCSECPVRLECLREALAEEQIALFGAWGGAMMTERNPTAPTEARRRSRVASRRARPGRGDPGVDAARTYRGVAPPRRRDPRCPSCRRAATPRSPHGALVVQARASGRRQVHHLGAVESPSRICPAHDRAMMRNNGNWPDAFHQVRSGFTMLVQVAELSLETLPRWGSRVRIPSSAPSRTAVRRELSGEAGRPAIDISPDDAHRRRSSRPDRRRTPDWQPPRPFMGGKS